MTEEKEIVQNLEEKESEPQEVDLEERGDREESEKEEKESEKVESEKVAVVTLSEEEIATREKEAEELKVKGNKLFQEGDSLSALACYKSAIETIPSSSSSKLAIYHCNAAACYLKFDRYDSAEESANSAVELNDQYVKAYLRRAVARENLDRKEESLKDFNKALELDPNSVSAKEGSERVAEAVRIKQEKEKEELMGKLKDLGDMVLKPFGMSTNDFQLQQDAKSGGYSVQMKQQK